MSSVISNLTRSVYKFLDKYSIGIVILVAAVLRVGHVLALRRLPLFDDLIIDSQVYDQWAQTIAAGDWFGGNSAFYMDPLYPYVLAFLYRCFGHDLLIVRLFQAVLGAVSCGFVGIIGRRVGGKAVGTTAALLMALYQPLIFESGEIEKTALGIFLFTASLVFATRRTVASKFSTGICLALAALTRGNLLLLAPFAAIYFLLDPDAGNACSSTPGFIARCRKRLMGGGGRNATAFILGFLLVLSPVLWRNHYVSGEWILMTSQSGQNFYTGNNPSNWTGAFDAVPFVRPSPRFEETDFRLKAEEITGMRLSPTEVSSFWFNQSINHILHNPKFAAMVFLRKFVLFWSDAEIGDGYSIYFIRQYSPALRISFLTLGWLLPFAVLGIIAQYRSNRYVRLLTMYVTIYCLSVVAFFIFSRYRIYVVPPLSILSAYGLSWTWDHVRERNWHRVIPGVLIASCVAILSFIGASTFVGLFPEKLVINYAHLSMLYEKKGEYKDAEALLLQGFKINPNESSLLFGLGSYYLRRDDPKRAFIYLNRCLQINEYQADAWFLLGHVNEKLGYIDQAKRCYQKQLEIIPGHQLAERYLRDLMSSPNRIRP